MFLVELLSADHLVECVDKGAPSIHIDVTSMVHQGYPVNRDTVKCGPSCFMILPKIDRNQMKSIFYDSDLVFPG